MVYIRKRWDVLLVDDEPDVLAVSRLALRRLKVYGIPVKLHECESKEQALAFLDNRADLPDLTLAIIDVVMETETAGLDLCHAIREDMDNKVTQLVIRTGQAGRAPERDVVDRYDISGYITKVEATEDRMYTIVKSAIRQFHWGRVFAAMFSWVRDLVHTQPTKEEIRATLARKMSLIAEDRHGNQLEGIEGHLGFFLGNDFVGIGECQERSRAEEIRAEVLETDETDPEYIRRSLDGGTTMVRAGEPAVFQVAAADGRDAVDCVVRSSFRPMPDYLLSSWSQMMQSLQVLWSRAS